MRAVSGSAQCPFSRSSSERPLISIRRDQGAAGFLSALYLGLARGLCFLLP